MAKVHGKEVFAYAADPEWGRYLPVPQPYERQHAIEFIEIQLGTDWLLNPVWAIEIDEVVCGGINLRVDAPHRKCELGYSLATWQWGKGLMTEAAGRVVDLAFELDAETHKVRAMADSRNIGSLRVMEKIGMVREGHLRENRYYRGEFIDEVWCGILRAEWERTVKGKR